MKLYELIYRCGNMGRDTHIELIRNGNDMFYGNLEVMPNAYKDFEVRYFEHVDDNRFEIVLKWGKTMTIHDILYNCGTVKSDSLVTIISTGGYKVKRQCFVKALESKYETLPFKTFTVSFMMWDNKPKLSIKFYV